MVDGEYLWMGVKTTHFTHFIQNIVIISYIAIRTKTIEILVLVHIAQPYASVCVCVYSRVYVCASVYSVCVSRFLKDNTHL